MQVIKPMALSLLSRPIAYRGNFGLCISAMMLTGMTGEDRSLANDATLWKFLAEQFPGGPLVDEGIVKQIPEYLVHGAAFAQGESAESVTVRARVGSLEKILHVSGDRAHQGDVVSRIVPFKHMPIDWAHAYGGPSVTVNTLGIGAPAAPESDEDAPQDLVVPMANVEYPGEVGLPASEPRTPAAFGAMPLDWLQRAQFRGTYDEDWFKSHSPGFPPDLDWRFFNLASADQWFESPLRGDETFSFEGMHPSFPQVSGSLPALRARCFVSAQHEEEPTLKEVPMRLTTLWFFPHVERVLLIFQGLCSTGTDDASDVLRLMGTIEGNDATKTDQHYADVLRKRLDPDTGALHALNDEDLMPETGLGPDKQFEAIVAEYQPQGLLAEAQLRRAQAQVRQMREILSAGGLDPDALGLKVPEREPTPTLPELPAYIEQKRAESAAAMKNAADKVQAQVANALEQAAAVGIDGTRTAPRGPPVYSALAQLEALIANLPAGTAGPDGKPIDVASMGPKFVMKELVGRDNYRQGAHAQTPVDPRPEGDRARFKADMERRRLTETRFDHEDFTGTDLSGLDLSGCSFFDAHLESADLTGANLSGADFTNAVLAHATLRNVNAAKARFVGANLGGANIDGAVFDTCDFSGSILMTLHFHGASFKQAIFTDARLLEATFGSCDFSGAHLARQHFIKCNLSGVRFDGANLSEANLVECVLSDTSCESASLVSANFLTCDLSAANLSGSDLGGAVFASGCDLSRATLSDASLKSANLRGAMLASAIFTRARLDGADLSEANASNANLDYTSAIGSLLIKTNLQGASAFGMNLMDAIIQKADLRGTDLRESNFHGADFSRVHVDQATRFDGSLTERMRTYPRRLQDTAA